MRLAGTVAVVTGGSSGIGLAVVRTFAREGARVFNFDIAPPAKPVAEVEFTHCDVTDAASVAAAGNDVLRSAGAPGVLVNNAGITRDALIQNMTDAMWEEVLAVNLRGVFHLGRFFGPRMMEQGAGSIINIASVVAEFGNIGQSNYAASKAGIIGLTKTWAKEFARKGAMVRVNAIAPGFIATELMRSVPDKVLAPILAATPLQRLGEPQEIANAALFLAGEESSFVTGHTLHVNGGLRL